MALADTGSTYNVRQSLLPDYSRNDLCEKCEESLHECVHKFTLFFMIDR